MSLDRVRQERQGTSATVRAEVAAGAAAAIQPDDDERISALYRRELTQTLVARAVGAALARARA